VELLRYSNIMFGGFDSLRHAFSPIEFKSIEWLVGKVEIRKGRAVVRAREEIRKLGDFLCKHWADQNTKQSMKISSVHES
jgi:hypothetical protein